MAQRKDPGIAVLLQAVIPGGGYFYLAQIGNGIVAVLGGLFIGGGLFLLGTSGQPILAIVIAVGLWVALLYDAHRQATKLLERHVAPSPAEPAPGDLPSRRKLKCPKCDNVALFSASEAKICPNCGYGG